VVDVPPIGDGSHYAVSPPTQFTAVTVDPEFPVFPHSSVVAHATQNPVPTAAMPSATHIPDEPTKKDGADSGKMSTTLLAAVIVVSVIFVVVVVLVVYAIVTRPTETGVAKKIEDGDELESEASAKVEAEGTS
jgi:hypothetical protein